jgi:hypothetical protein
LVVGEGARARYLYGIGFTRQIWHRSDIPGTRQIVEAKDLSEIREKLATLPLAKAGMLLRPSRPHRSC